MGRRAAGAVAVLAISSMATLAAYMIFLGWDQEKVLGSDGYLHGPYEAWQVVGLGAVMALIAASLGWVSRSWVGALGCTLTLTWAWSIDAATDPEDDGLWPLSATALAIGSCAVLLVITRLAASFRGRAGAPAGHRPPA